MIVGALSPLRIDVVKKGFSTRPNYSGTSVSYGVMLANTSQLQDARDVTVLVNFVLADNHLLGSASTSVAAIRAGSTYALGGDVSFPAGAPVERLEVVVQVGSRARSSARTPALANVHLVPDLLDLGWLGSVEGDLINDQAGLTLQSAHLSAVVFDASGNVLGGGSGYAFASLPTGTRQFFKLTMGFRSVSMERADSVQVSVEPTFKQPGS
jgi:hypothetical protein